MIEDDVSTSEAHKKAVHAGWYTHQFLKTRLAKSVNLSSVYSQAQFRTVPLAGGTFTGNLAAHAVAVVTPRLDHLD